MKILFMGGKKIGYEICLFLMSKGHELKCVFNNGEQYALPWMPTPLSIRPLVEIPESEVVNYKPDVIFVAFYDKIIKEPLISIAPLGAWNLHLGDTEKYRGAYPNVRALANGDDTYAVTLHRIDAGIDTGPILDKISFPIAPEMTGKDLYDRMVEEGLRLFMRSFDMILSGKYITRPNNGKGVIGYKKDLRHDVKVSAELRNAVRSLTFPPFPAPRFKIGDKTFIIVEEKSCMH